MKETPQLDHRPKIQARIPLAIIHHSSITAEQQSLILAREGLVIENLSDYGAEIPLNSYMRIFEELSIVTKSPTLGLQISNQMGPELVGAVGFIFLSSPDLKSAIEYYSRSVSSIQEVTQLTFSNLDLPTLRYIITDDNIRPRRQDVEFSIGYVNGLLKRYIGDKYRPREIYFEHAKPITGSYYESFFDCPVFFEQEMNAIVLDDKDLTKGSAKFDKHLIPLLEHYLQLLEQDTQMPTSFAEKINQLLPHCIEHDLANISYVAGRLGMSEVTVRRRLKNEDTSFRLLLQRKRISISKRLLIETSMNILEVAQKVGYSETASFTRVFHKETNKTPTQFRQSL